MRGNASHRFRQGADHEHVGIHARTRIPPAAISHKQFDRPSNPPIGDTKKDSFAVARERWVYPNNIMPVQIGSKNHSFSEPTRLLSDCHRRIEMFLGSLERVAGISDRPLNADSRQALDAALRYFREAAPKHTADEEESLFPRLRQMKNPELESAIRRLEPLEHDHRRADALHAEVDRLGRECLARGVLSADESLRLRQAILTLVDIYKEHIRIEDEDVFPVAGKVLSAADKAAIAREMAARRN
jgi:hemerythrin-like domain-containing protein